MHTLIVLFGEKCLVTSEFEYELGRQKDKTFFPILGACHLQSKSAGFIVSFLVIRDTRSDNAFVSIEFSVYGRENTKKFGNLLAGYSSQLGRLIDSIKDCEFTTPVPFDDVDKIARKQTTNKIKQYLLHSDPEETFTLIKACDTNTDPTEIIKAFLVFGLLYTTMIQDKQNIKEFERNLQKLL